jgi:hypothetical protein
MGSRLLGAHKWSMMDSISIYYYLYGVERIDYALTRLVYSQCNCVPLPSSITQIEYGKIGILSIREARNNE